jgi:hypothetical protein
MAAGWLMNPTSPAARRYACPFPNLNGRWKISTDGGLEACLVAERRGLFYRNGQKMMTVSVETSRSVKNRRFLEQRMRSATVQNGHSSPHFDGTNEPVTHLPVA